jgi:hypothetical protein
LTTYCAKKKRNDAREQIVPMPQLNTKSSRCRSCQNRTNCHFVSWCWGLLLACKGTDITINAQTYYGTLHDLCTTIKRKHDNAWQNLSQYGMLCPERGALHTLAIGPSSI